ncbi:T9SS type A sorting domain-containing protein [Gracilimonas sp.]|uniref:T9SS type A sorting domain-containing protein n=1 Tax=Gracilimonas sp. TaxID=1974203 RepID=UPI003BAB5456
MKHQLKNILQSSLNIYLCGGLLTVFLALFAVDGLSQQLAFPGAEGFGKYTSGGRGGEVYTVTNLNDSGSGSLRFGVEMEGARTIVFSLSGTIELETDLRIRNDSISIFGQTAPGDGIAIKGRATVIDADNVIIQHIRFRPGDIGSGDLDGVDALWGRENKDIMVDHVSMSWSIDEAGSFYDNENFTLQWSILSESLYNSIHSKSEHGYGGIWGGAGATFHHNLLAHHTSRNPRFNGGRYTTTKQNEIADFRNNVIYNWGHNSAYGGENGNYNIVANYYKSGPATEDKDRILDADANNGADWYIADNYVDGYPTITADNWDGGVQNITENEEELIRATEPFEAPALESFETAEEAFESVLANAGAILPRRDTIDSRIVDETLNGTATYGSTYGAGTGIIDSQEDVGGWPELNSAPYPEDADGDGIPNSWELENDLNPENPEDGRSIAVNGYSNLENYIHSIQTQGEFTPAPGNLALVSPVGESNVSVQPEFSWTEASFAENYELEIRDGAGEWADVVYEVSVGDTMYTLPQDTQLVGDETYFWRVRGTNESGNGVWTDFEFFVTRVVTSNESDSNVPSEFTLSQNYPNPFNPSTNISYGLPRSAYIEIKVYDMAGREVAQILSGRQSSGYHTIGFDASTFASGIYIYRLTASSTEATRDKMFSLTRKMTLIK